MGKSERALAVGKKSKAKKTEVKIASPDTKSTQSEDIFAKTSNFAPERIARIHALKETINPYNLGEIGALAQREIAQLSKNILERVRTRDAGEAGEFLTRLIAQVKELDANSLANRSESALQKIPLIRRAFDKTRSFIASYESVASKVDRIASALGRERQALVKDSTMLDTLYEENEKLYSNLVDIITAAELRLAELTEELAILREEAEATGDRMDHQKASDLSGALARFENKLQDLRISRTIAIQTAPQIRLVQAGDHALIDKIETSLALTIPLWQNQVLIAISLFNQKKALELQNAVTNATNELIVKNADLLKQSAADVARETNRGVAAVDAIQKATGQLESAIHEVRSIVEQSRSDRLKGQEELEKIETKLLTAMAGEEESETERLERQG